MVLTGPNYIDRKKGSCFPDAPLGHRVDIEKERSRAINCGGALVILWVPVLCFGLAGLGLERRENEGREKVSDYPYYFNIVSGLMALVTGLLTLGNLRANALSGGSTEVAEKPCWSPKTTYNVLKVCHIINLMFLCLCALGYSTKVFQSLHGSSESSLDVLAIIAFALVALLAVVHILFLTFLHRLEMKIVPNPDGVLRVRKKFAVEEPQDELQAARSTIFVLGVVGVILHGLLLWCLGAARLWPVVVILGGGLPFGGVVSMMMLLQGSSREGVLNLACCCSCTVGGSVTTALRVMNLVNAIFSLIAAIVTIFGIVGFAARSNVEIPFQVVGLLVHVAIGILNILAWPKLSALDQEVAAKELAAEQAAELKRLAEEAAQEVTQLIAGAGAEEGTQQNNTVQMRLGQN